MSIKRPAWQQEGREPDYRFSLANERTFLAWIRTALAVIAGGVLLHQLGMSSRNGPLNAPLASGLILFGGLLAAFAYRRWKSHEVAMRHGRPLGAATGFLALSAGIMLAAGALAIAVLP
jgi:putative membrane protein